MAMFRRPRPAGGRHPPPLAPTVSTFKPRSEWNSVGSSMFLYVNLPGFYSEQININKNAGARTIQVQGQRPLSTRTRARFNEIYRVPEACDMNNIKTSFVHGLLTIELPMIVTKEKEEQRAQELGKGMQTKPYKEESNKNGADGNLGNKQPPKDQEKATQRGKEVEGDGSRSVKDGRMVEDKSEGSLESKKHAKEEKVVEEKKFNGGGHGKSEGSLEIKKHAKEEKVIEDKKLDGGGQSKSEGSLESKKQGKEEKVIEDKKFNAGGQGRFDQQKRKEERNSSSEGSRALEGRSEQTKQANKEKPVGEDEVAGKHKAKEEEGLRISSNTDGTLGGKKHEEKDEVAIKEKGTQERFKPEVKERKDRSSEVDDVLGSKQPEKDLDKKLGFEREELRKQEDPRKNKPDEEGEDRERKVEKYMESESVKDQKKINDEEPLPSYGDDLQKSLLQRMEEEQVDNHGKYMVNIGIAALVLMGFGAYLFLPFLKLFS